MKNTEEAKSTLDTAAPTNRLKFVFFALVLLIGVPVIISFVINAYEHQLTVLTIDARGIMHTTVPTSAAPYSSPAIKTSFQTAEAAFAAMGRSQDTVQARIDRLRTIQLLVTLLLGVLGILACWYTRAALISMRNSLRENQGRALALEGLFDTANHLSLTGSPEETHRYLTERIAKILSTDKALLWSFDDRKNTLTALWPAFGFANVAEETTLSGQQGKWALDLLKDNQALRADHSGANEELRSLLKILGANSILAVPLIARGKPVGVLTAFDKVQSSPFTDADERLMRTFAGQGAFVLHSGHLYARMVARTRHLATLAHITGLINSSLQLDEMFTAFLREAHTLVPFRSATLALAPMSEEASSWVADEGYHASGTDEEGKVEETELLRRLRGKDASISGTSKVERRQELSLGLPTWNINRDDVRVKSGILEVSKAGPVGWVLEHGRSWTAAEDSAVVGDQEYVRIVVPLVVQQQTLGALDFEVDGPESMSQTHLIMARQVAGQLAIAVQNARLYRDAKHRAEQMEWAMQESHHRIKNNLQAVSAILDLYLMDEGAGEHGPVEGLRHALREVRTIAAVHDLLSEDVRLGRVDVRTLLEMLVPLLVSGPSALGKKITARVEAAASMLPSKIASAIALSVNELVINAIQHGSCGRSSVDICVTLSRDAEAIYLSVDDDGPGFEDDFDLNVSAGIGLNLVSTLIERDHCGKLTFKSEAGAQVSAVIPYRGRLDSREFVNGQEVTRES